MKLAIMQPYFFPYIGYWQLVNAVDRFVIYDDVNYIKGGWINRNRILINGESTYITIPLYQASSFKRIVDISLQPSNIWRNKLVKMVETTYRRAPFFNDVFPVIDSVIRYETDNLSAYLSYQLQILSELLEIKTEFVVTSRNYENNELSGQERVLDICQREGASTYINLQGGKQLYNRGMFAENDLDLKFLTPSPMEYKQSGVEYVPWLSVIDVLMFNSKSQLMQMLNNYELV